MEIASIQIILKSLFNYGSGKWDRTTDLGLMSPAL